MFWPHHPQPVTPRKAVAELTVYRTASAPLNTTTIIIEAVPPSQPAPTTTRRPR